MTDDANFYTDAEIAFLKTLGLHSARGRHTSRQSLLQGYLRGCELRQVWDELDCARIMETVLNEIKRIK
jgi:hypothetical protein